MKKNILPKKFFIINNIVNEMGSYKVRFFAVVETIKIFKKKYAKNVEFMILLNGLLDDISSLETISLKNNIEQTVVDEFKDLFSLLFRENKLKIKYDLEYETDYCTHINIILNDENNLHKVVNDKYSSSCYSFKNKVNNIDINLLVDIQFDLSFFKGKNEIYSVNDNLIDDAFSGGVYNKITYDLFIHNQIYNSLDMRNHLNTTHYLDVMDFIYFNYEGVLINIFNEKDFNTFIEDFINMSIIHNIEKHIKPIDNNRYIIDENLRNKLDLRKVNLVLKETVKSNIGFFPQLLNLVSSGDLIDDCARQSGSYFKTEITDTLTNDVYILTKTIYSDYELTKK